MDFKITELEISAMEKEIADNYPQAIGSAVFHQWLHEPTSDMVLLPRWIRIAHLLKANGGWEVSGWGIISYHYEYQRGLEQDDALELMFYSGMFAGFEQWQGPFSAFTEFNPYFARYNTWVKEVIERESA